MPRLTKSTVPAFSTSKDRHAVDRRLLVGLRRRVGNVIGADDESNVSGAEFGVDVFELEDFIIRNLRFREEHIHVPRHAPGDRMNGVFHFNAFFFQTVRHLFQGVLGLGDRHAVSRHHDHFAGVAHDGMQRRPRSPV